METRSKRTAAAAAVLVALSAAVGSVQAQTSCRDLIGFNSLLAKPLEPTTGAWAATEDNGDSFLGNKDVDNCAVKVVTGPRAKVSMTVYEAGPMTQNECSVYNTLSSIDSKLEQGKVADAGSTTTKLISRLDGWAGSAKLIDPGYGQIRTAITQVQSCIMGL
ncbi:hypothetical protein [uncultured Piscinibacter sp.]|uniref:hypothetical protein n=1 Tax=uncultured Piscinibacter sp. TaxID=1131835 RepID=UPI002607D931|nr:hypothetical protein [uncultured Piscinibacter sp.]